MPITDLNEYRRRRETDPAHLYIDDEGHAWYEYLVSYTDQRDLTMVFSIWATSFDDAERRLEMIKDTATVEGKVQGEIDT